MMHENHLDCETPSTVLYSDLRAFGGISNKEAASMLLSNRVTVGGVSPRSRIESRTYLSRNIVHASPAIVNPTFFADFSISVQSVYARIKAKRGNEDDAISAHYGIEVAPAMEAALSNNGLDARVYANECSRLQSVSLRSERDRPLLLLMLFCATGCLADPHRAVQVVEDFASHMLAQHLLTPSLSAIGNRRREVESSDEDGESSLGLLRMIDGVACPPIVVLNPQGSLVGTHAEGEGSIANVSVDVSRQHAKIWRDGSHWLCGGLDSTNGTFVVTNHGKSMRCVEPPRNKRASHARFPPQEIHEGDVLCFGSSTRFLAMKIA